MNALAKIIQDINSLSQSSTIMGGNLKYIILALLVAVEGPIATLLGAAAAASGVMHLNLVFLSACLGNLCADSVYYSLGYTGKKEWLLRTGRRFGLTENLLQRLQVKIQEHAPKFIFLAKITNGLIIPSLITAGLAKVPWKKWFPPLAAGEMLWTGALVSIGYYTTHTIQQLQKDIHIFIIFTSIVFLLGILLLIRKFIQKKGLRFFSDFIEDKQE
jgi:membrane protein DedA with SNARE-associated domain